MLLPIVRATTLHDLDELTANKSFSKRKFVYVEVCFQLLHTGIAWRGVLGAKSQYAE
jgi:hypothetical protein